MNVDLVAFMGMPCLTALATAFAVGTQAGPRLGPRLGRGVGVAVLAWRCPSVGYTFGEAAPDSS